MKTICTFLAAALLCGCASAGKNFDSRKITAIKKGETTEAELIAMFGKPQTTNISSEQGRTLVWVYVQVAATPFGSSQKSKSLAVSLGTNAIVTNYQFSNSGIDADLGTQHDPEAPSVKPAQSPKGR